MCGGGKGAGGGGEKIGGRETATDREGERETDRDKLRVGERKRERPTDRETEGRSIKAAYFYTVPHEQTFMLVYGLCWFMLRMSTEPKPQWQVEFFGCFGARAAF